MANLDNVWAYGVAGVIALITTIYLFAAMIFPEKF
jgi:K+-transporting ATPase KdpF subunit